MDTTKLDKLNLCVKCGETYDPESKSACSVGLIHIPAVRNAKPSLPDWLEQQTKKRKGGYDAMAVLKLLCSAIKNSHSPFLAFFADHEDGVSFYTYRNGIMQKWLICPEGVAEMPL